MIKTGGTGDPVIIIIIIVGSSETNELPSCLLKVFVLSFFTFFNDALKIRHFNLKHRIRN